MNCEKFLNKKILVKQTKSRIGIGEKQQGNLRGLGLGKIGNVSELQCTESVLGMLKKVEHLVSIQESKK